MQRAHRGTTEVPQGYRRGTTEVPQRYRRGTTEVPQRYHRGTKLQKTYSANSYLEASLSRIDVTIRSDDVISVRRLRNSSSIYPAWITRT